MAKYKTSQTEALLEAWEETYKKGQLTLWVFMALRDRERYVDEIQAFVYDKSKNTLQCEGQSLYRMLRKFKELELVDFTTRPGAGGPERKYYFLTRDGEALLTQFAQRNISLFFEPDIQKILFPAQHKKQLKTCMV